MFEPLPAALAIAGLLAVLSLVQWVAIPALKRAWLAYWTDGELPMSFWLAVTGAIFLLSAGLAVAGGDLRWMAGGLMAGTAVSVVASRSRR